MYSYFTHYSKCCVCCKCNVFILLDGYTICSNCGLILASETAERDFIPAGYYKKYKRKKESKQRKKEKFEKYYQQKYKGKGQRASP